MSENTSFYQKSLIHLTREQKTQLREVLKLMLKESMTGCLKVHLKDGGVIGIESHKSIDSNPVDGG